MVSRYAQRIFIEAVTVNPTNGEPVPVAKDGPPEMRGPEEIKELLKGKKIPSGFFYLPGAENVSAVLFSSSGIISKFNRLGRLAGFGVPNLKLIRYGVCHDHAPNAALPRPFVVEVEPGKCIETWGEGLSLFHNPNARHPVPKEMFPSIAHHKFIDGQIRSILPEFHPYTSMTWNMLITE